ncbi:hypothetical protein V2J09_019623 [Rumex salicifolius]
MKGASIFSRILSQGFISRNPNFRFNLIRSLSNPPGPLVQYKKLVEQGKLQHDPHQEKVAVELENLLGRLEEYDKNMADYHVRLADWESRREEEHRKLLMKEAKQQQEGGGWAAVKKKPKRLLESWMFQTKSNDVELGPGKWVSYLNRERKLDSLVGKRPVAPPAPKGLYLHGNVGSGKTMLMDMFYAATEGTVQHRRRLHFHEAMLEIHSHMHQIWKKQVEEKSFQSSISSWVMNLPFDTKIKEWLAEEEQYKQAIQVTNILPTVADRFLVDQQVKKRGASILCFDEIQTVDVFAVVALSGILSKLLSSGTVLVATSNRAPQDLNQDGMQNEIFLQMVEKMEKHCDHVLIDSGIDFRRIIAQTSELQNHYLWPMNNETAKEFDEMWHQFTRQSGERIESSTIPVMFGRTLGVPESCNGVARFSFEYLCGRPVGAADYIALANNYHTVFISGIPEMSMRIRDKARRFITLIDELYNHHCCLFCTAACSIEDLFKGTEEGSLFDLESFQFETEMEGGKLRRDVLAEGHVGTGGSPSAIISILSGKEEMFAFKRAVSRLIEMQTPLYLEGVHLYHPRFQAHLNEARRVRQPRTSL